MGHYLNVNYTSANRQIAVDIPAPTEISGYDFEIEFEVKVTGTNIILMGPNVSSTGNIAYLKSSMLEYRNSGNSNILMTHGADIAEWHVYRMVFTGTDAGNIALYVDNVFKANYTPSSSVATQPFKSLLHIGSNANRKAHFRYFKFTDRNNPASNRMYDARAYVVGDELVGRLRDTVNDVNGTADTGWIALPMEFVTDAPVLTPIAFSGPIADQVFMVGDTINLNFAGNFTGNQPPFTASSIGAAFSGVGVSLNTDFTVTGTATEGSADVQIRGTDSAANTADSNVFNITVNPVVALPPQGTANIGTIAVTETTANIPFTYNATDADEFDIYIDTVYFSTVLASPVSITDLTAGYTYAAVVVPVNGNGDGVPSASVEFTTVASAPTDPRIVFSAGNELVYNTAILRANETGFVVDIHNPEDGQLIARFTGQSTLSGGLMNTIQSTLLPASTEVRVTITAPDGAECVFRETTQ
jgi:hypothetical protein